MPRPRTPDIALGCAVAAWAVIFLPHEPFPAGGIALVAGLSSLMWRRPYSAMSLAVTANLAGGVWYGDLPIQEWNIPVSVVAAASAAVFLNPLLACTGVVILGASVALSMETTALGTDWIWPTAVMSFVAIPAGLIARAARRAQLAWTRVEQLAATTPEMVARRAVAEERVRLTSDIHLVIRTSVMSMREHADAAAAAWQVDPRPSLRAIQAGGRRAIGELRRLLGLLRDDPEKDDTVGGTAKPVADGDARTRVPWWVNALLALGAIAVATVEFFAWQENRLGEAATSSLLATLLAAAPVVLRGRAPGMGAALCGAVFLVSAVVGRPVAPGIWCLAVVGTLTWTALYRAKPVDIAGVVALLAGQLVFAALIAPEQLSFMIISVVTAGAAGFLTARRNALLRLAAGRSARLTAERAIATERAVRAERLTLARELHDMVSHAVVLMVVQAGAAEALLATNAARARAALDLVSGNADATLEELGRLLSALSDDTSSGEGATPDTHSLPALVDRMRAGGLDVDFDQQGTPGDARGATVYRIVQETLTNALRHAPQAHVAVRVANLPDGTTVEVVDDGPGAGADTHRGYGLIGMTERVERAGGTIHTGSGRDGTGFRVCATLPTVDRSVV